MSHITLLAWLVLMAVVYPSHPAEAQECPIPMDSAAAPDPGATAAPAPVPGASTAAPDPGDPSAVAFPVPGAMTVAPPPMPDTPVDCSVTNPPPPP